MKTLVTYSLAACVAAVSRGNLKEIGKADDIIISSFTQLQADDGDGASINNPALHPPELGSGGYRRFRTISGEGHQPVVDKNKAEGASADNATLNTQHNVTDQKQSEVEMGRPSTNTASSTNYEDHADSTRRRKVFNFSQKTENNSFD